MSKSTLDPKNLLQAMVALPNKKIARKKLTKVACKRSKKHSRNMLQNLIKSAQERIEPRQLTLRELMPLTIAQLLLPTIIGATSGPFIGRIAKGVWDPRDVLWGGLGGTAVSATQLGLDTLGKAIGSEGSLHHVARTIAPYLVYAPFFGKIARGDWNLGDILISAAGLLATGLTSAAALGLGSLSLPKE